MKKIITADTIGPGTLLLSKLNRKGRTPAEPAAPLAAILMKANTITASTTPPPATATPITPARHGQNFEDPFAADLRAIAEHRQVVLDQIKAVQRNGEKPTVQVTFTGRE